MDKISVEVRTFFFPFSSKELMPFDGSKKQRRKGRKTSNRKNEKCGEKKEKKEKERKRKKKKKKKKEKKRKRSKLLLATNQNSCKYWGFFKLLPILFTPVCCGFIPHYNFKNAPKPRFPCLPPFRAGLLDL